MARRSQETGLIDYHDGRGAGSVVNSAYCSYGGLGFGSHRPHAGSHVLVISVPGDLTPLGSSGTCMHIVHINSHTHMRVHANTNTQTHTGIHHTHTHIHANRQTHKLTQAYATHTHACTHTHKLTQTYRQTDTQSCNFLVVTYVCIHVPQPPLSALDVRPSEMLGPLTGQ